MTPPSCARSALLLGSLLAALGLPASAQTAAPPLAAPEALACAPRLAPDESTSGGRVLGAPDAPLREMFGLRDVVQLSLGRAEGVSVGTQFFTRRGEPPVDLDMRARGLRVLRTSGWLRAVLVDEHSTVAVVERVCAEIRRGDQLVPLQWPAAVSVAPEGTVDYDDPATVLFGPDGRAMLGTRQFLVIDQGADRQIVPGQRLTLFRAAPDGSLEVVIQLGEGVAVLVDTTSATVQVTRARESIRSGDLAAVHR